MLDRGGHPLVSVHWSDALQNWRFFGVTLWRRHVSFPSTISQLSLARLLESGPATTVYGFFHSNQFSYNAPISYVSTFRLHSSWHRWLSQTDGRRASSPQPSNWSYGSPLYWQSESECFHPYTTEFAKNPFKKERTAAGRYLHKNIYKNISEEGCQHHEEDITTYNDSCIWQQK